MAAVLQASGVSASGAGTASMRRKTPTPPPRPMACRLHQLPGAPPGGCPPGPGSPGPVRVLTDPVVIHTPSRRSDQREGAWPGHPADAGPGGRGRSAPTHEPGVGDRSRGAPEGTRLTSGEALGWLRSANPTGDLDGPEARPRLRRRWTGWGGEGSAATGAGPLGSPSAVLPGRGGPTPGAWGPPGRGQGQPGARPKNGGGAPPEPTAGHPPADGRSPGWGQEGLRGP